jgi:replicative DNA helicase
MSSREQRISAARDSNPFQARELPNNIEAEQGLLGAVLVNNAAMTVVPPSLETDHFHEPIHRAIFDAIKACIKAGKMANPVTIRSFIAPDLAAAPVGDITVSQYLARLSADAVSIINVPDFASAIIFYAQRRAALGTAESVDVAGWNADDEIAFVDQIRESRDRLTNILTTLEGQGDEHRTFAEAVDESLDRTEQAYQGRLPVGIDPGLPELMTLTGPWQNGQLIIIGGGVKQGKSALAMQSLFTIAEKHPVAVNSGEMSRTQLTMREKSRRTGISATKQQRGQVSETEFEALMRAGEEMKRLKHIDIDCRRLTLQQIDSKIGRLISEFGIEAYFLDHLGKIQWTGKMEYEDEFKQGQRATSMLKDLAQKHNIPIVALTHLKKATFQDYQGRSFRDRINAAISRRPTYRDLVGNMDKDADQVLIVFQPKPIVAGMEPGENTEDYTVWEDAMERVTGKADIILSLSRESEFPRRKEIQWTGSTTSYGLPFKQAMNERGLFA